MRVQCVCVCVLAEPPVLLHKSANLDRPINSVSRFTCLFDGWPAPDVTWMHNGYPIAATTGAAAGGERHRLMQGGTELLVQQSQPSDSGYYQCLARNDGGSAGGIIYLYVPQRHSEYW